MKSGLILCLLTLIVSQHHCAQVGNDSYSHIQRKPFFEMERHRKSVYCTRVCNGYFISPPDCPGRHNYFSSLCLCSKSVKRIRNSNCWTHDSQPPIKNMQRRFKSCSEKCRSQVSENIYAALCSSRHPKPSDPLIRDCLCVTFTKMLPRPPKASEGDNIDDYEEEDDFDEIENENGNSCRIL